MPNVLRLSLEHDTDGTGQLFVTVSQGSFGGTSFAWFSTLHLGNFGRLLQDTFPIPADAPLLLQGGFWSNTTKDLEQAHVLLKFYPIGGTGLVGVRVQLSSPLYPEDRAESQSAVAVELRTNSEPLRSFGRHLVSLANEEVTFAVLEASDG